MYDYDFDADACSAETPATEDCYHPVALTAVQDQIVALLTVPISGDASQSGRDLLSLTLLALLRERLPRQSEASPHAVASTIHDAVAILQQRIGHLMAITYACGQERLRELADTSASPELIARALALVAEMTETGV